MKSKETLEGLRPYIPGRPIDDVKKEYGLTRVVKLASNENPYGFSPKVKELLVNEIESLEYYPDGGAVDLKEKLAEFHQISTDQLIVGAGLDEVIQIVSRAMLVSGDEIIVPDPTFPQYGHHATIEGADVVKVPVHPATGEMDLEKMLESITFDTKIIWLCNPNNPTGTYVSQYKIKDFMEKVPDHILVISDEAYQEYVTEEEIGTSFILLNEYDNLMIMRTFSKVYGLAGLRIGYGIMSVALGKTLEVARLPFNTSTLAQKAAIVALEDQEFISRATKKNTAELEAWEKFLEELAIPYYVSQTNFIFVNVGEKSDEITQGLLESGFIIRGGLKPGWVRITMGQKEDNEALRNVLKNLL